MLYLVLDSYLMSVPTFYGLTCVRFLSMSEQVFYGLLFVRFSSKVRASIL